MKCTLWSSMVGLCCTALLTACGAASDGAGGKFEPLLGLNGKQVGNLLFDAKSQPLVGGYGGLWRYSDADGWLPLGKVDSAVSIVHQYPADGGGSYAVDGSTLYKVELDARTWSVVKSYASADGNKHYVVTLVTGDGTLYGTQSGSSQMPVYWPASGSGWVPVPNPPDQFGSYPMIADAAHDIFFFVDGENVIRRDASGTDSVFVDCHTKELLQCSMTLYPLRVLADGTLYLFSRTPLAIRVYKVPAAGGNPVLAAALPSGDPPNDYVYADDFSVTDNGTVYITGKRSSDAYGYGSTFRFSPGNSSGSMMLASPGDFEAPSSVTPAPDANIAVSPDNTLYSILPVMGGVARFQH